MKNLKFLFVFISIAILSFSKIPAEGFDTTPPKIDSCTITPRQISDVTGGNVRVTLHITSKNGLSGQALSVLNLKNSFTLRQLGGFIMTLDSGDEYSGTWVQDIDVKPGLMPGIYELSIFPLRDKLQNEISFSGCPGQDVTYGVVTPTPTPTPKVTATSSPSPIPTVTATATPVSNISLAIDVLKAQLALAQSENRILALKIKKICSTRPKPKGC